MRMKINTSMHEQEANAHDNASERHAVGPLAAHRIVSMLSKNSKYYVYFCVCV